MRKFASNSSKVITDIPVEDREDVIHVSNMQYVKTLGLHWSPIDDIYGFDYHSQSSSKRTTKGKILSHMASIFDPLGLINPIIVICKLLMQTLWSMKLVWDESVTQDIFTQWEHIRQQLQLIGTVKINRFVSFNKYTQIHAFSDASTKAYGACIYAVTTSNEGTSSMLLCSKSRVAPLKQISLPRLELCAAHLLSQLLSSVIETLPTTPEEINCWSDSTITLAWIAGDPARWTTFVANRVTKIQILTRNCMWRHVPSVSNPADLLSLINNNLWFFGPSFIQMPKSQWPPEPQSESVDIESRPQIQVLAATISTDIISEHKYANIYNKMVRMFVYINRFITFCRKVKPNLGQITTTELNDAILTIFRVIQTFLIRNTLYFFASIRSSFNSPPSS